MKRFSVLSAFEEDGCHGKEKEVTNEEPVLINGIFLNVLFSPVSFSNLLCYFCFYIRKNECVQNSLFLLNSFHSCAR